MRRPRSRAAILSVLVVGMLIFLGMLFVWNNVTDIFLKPVSNSTTNVTIDIQPGETTPEIANDLQSKGVIRNAFAFTIWARIKGLDTKLEAGVYKQISPNMTISSIIDTLQNGRPDAILVLVKEGKRLEEIANMAANANLPNFSKTQFLTYTKHINKFPDAGKYSILKNVPENGSMEGLLFPDTYELSPKATARDLINSMLTEMTDNISKNHLDQAAQKHNMKLYDFLTLASIVEREAGIHDDKSKIASVYWNRIYTTNGKEQTGGGKLQADPTVQYARDTEHPPTTYWQPLADSGSKIAPNSQWNTYNITGLPPTPICSPGLDSLKAAANPANTDYLFFFAAKDDGKTYYQATIQQFEAEMNKHGVR
ncbi:endolytic transglycosylase MltG [Dictyobacter formicarum]|uniref:Endolytic murein transglycosylase n=1 Tax=Dictyobacter formicarum TaxID=2778368 RepID=A0ABQ3VP79_9CHLR|nr:endolytic transglycosylase MltG [Dictyobacter formicarum]GHO86896.1 aminodeoxychorismate lyase [Dictyobacter formicarum]